jgi:hypothetical protein
MVRMRIFGLLLLVAVRVAAADEAPGGAAATAAAMATSVAAPATTAGPAAASNVPAAKPQGAGTAPAQGKPEAPSAASGPLPTGGDVKMSGMSILGNEDAPKSLVIVPWKSSERADMPSVSRLLDSDTQPIDKDVFMRELAYYEFKSSPK